MENIKSFITKYNLLVLLSLTFISAATYIFKELSFTNLAGIIYRIIIGVLIITYLILFIACAKPRVSKHFLIVLSAYLIISILSLFISPVIAGKEISGIQFFLGIATIFSNIGSIILFIESSKPKQCELTYKLFINIFLGVVVLMCFYTYIFQHEQIYQTLNNIHGWNYDVTSIFYEKTTYGFFLTMGSVFAIFHALTKEKYLYLFLPPFFIFNSILSRNKTSLLIIAILIAFSIIVIVKKTFAKNKILCISVLSSALVILSISILLLLFVPSLSNIKYFIESSIFKDGIIVMQDRFNKWCSFLASIDNLFNIFFGYGERISRFIVINNVTDNAFLISLETGGILKLIIHILLIVYIYLTTSKKSNSFIRIVIITIVLISGFFEDNYIYGFNVTSLAAAPIIYSILY